MDTVHHYQVKLNWESERKGLMTSPVLNSNIEVATPPEFPKGIPGIWSPEHLLVAAVNSCLMTTFLAIAENSKFDFISFESKADGKLEKVEGKLMISEIVLAPLLTLSNEADKERGLRISYDILIIATGARIAPEEVEGMNGKEWQNSVFDFYTFEGALALRNKLREWHGGKLVVHITEMPIKCPVAPLEFAFLADSYFKHKKMRNKVEITYVTPMSGAFTKPKADAALHHLLEEKKISIEADFAIAEVDNENKKIIDWGGREILFDLLVTVPTNKGDDVIERSGLGDDLNYVPTNKGSLQSLAHKNIFVIGDATNIPASKAGSVAHFEAEILTENILRYIKGLSLREEFDGHANCFVETGNNRALLIDFNYTHEPVKGEFPFAKIGPLKLLKESKVNHLGKLAFRWVYWNMLLKATPIPFVPAKMKLAGKHFD